MAIDTLAQRQLRRHYATLQPAEVAVAERDRILSVVAESNPDALHRALAIIVAWRDRGAPFSANDVRDDMDRAGIRTPVRGSAFAMAKRRHLIVSVGLEPSTDKGTHAKRIELYADPFGGAHRGPVQPAQDPARGVAPDQPPPDQPRLDRPAPGVIAQASVEREPRQTRRRPTRTTTRPEEITVPVHRTRSGQFSTTSDITPEQGDLFAELTS